MPVTRNRWVCLRNQMILNVNYVGTRIDSPTVALTR